MYLSSGFCWWSGEFKGYIVHAHIPAPWCCAYKQCLVPHSSAYSAHISRQRYILVYPPKVRRRTITAQISIRLGRHYNIFQYTKLYRLVSVPYQVYILCVQVRPRAGWMPNCLPSFIWMHGVDRESHYNYMCLFPSPSPRDLDLRVAPLACLFLRVHIWKGRRSYVWYRSVNFCFVSVNDYTLVVWIYNCVAAWENPSFLIFFYLI